MFRTSRRTAAIIAGSAVIVSATVATVLLLTDNAQPLPAAAGAGSMAVRAAGRHAAPPEQVERVSPADGAKGLSGSRPITFTFSAPLADSSALPVLSPAVPGQWRRAGNTATFTPSQPFPGGIRVSLQVPGGIEGVRSDAGGQLPQTWASSFTTRPYAVLRLQQILAQLGYLPLSWTPAERAALPGTAAGAQIAAAYSPPPGDFRWLNHWPSSLQDQWRPGSPNMLDVGAIYGFEADHGMTPDGDASPAVWAALLKAAVTDKRGNTHGYSYAIATRSIPNTLTIWHNGREVLSSPTNTGIAARPTPLGTWPVYEKLPFQVMTGHNPNGSYYADPVQWVSYFTDGSAVHYYARGSYGWPQSLGCLELPYTAAKTSYGYLPYGTLITVVP